MVRSRYREWNNEGRVGMLALFCLLGPAVTTLPTMPKAIGGVRCKRYQRLGYAALLFVVVHLAVLLRC